MAKDFRADRIRTRVIIGTGSVRSDKPHLGLAFYSASKASDFQGDTTVNFTNVGDDVWLYFDGSPTTSGFTTPDGSSVLFAGDVVVSGTLWGNRSVVEVSDSVKGDLFAPNRAVLGGSDFQDNDSTTLLLVDPFTPNLPIGTSKNGTVSFGVVDGRDYPTAYNQDVFFHVTGSRNSKGTTSRGVALFDGDVFISGNFELSPDSAFSLAGDFSIGGDLTVGGNDILGSAGTAISFGAVTPDLETAHGLKIGNDALTGSDDSVFIYHSGSGNVGVDGTLQVSGRRIKDHKDRTILKFADSFPALDGRLEITGSALIDPAQIRIWGDNNPAAVVLINRTLSTDTGDGLGGLAFFSTDNIVPMPVAGAYIQAGATADWDIGAGGSVADSNLEFWTRGTGDTEPIERVTIENNPEVSGRVQLTVSGNLKLADGTAPGGGSFGASVLSADDIESFKVFDNGSVYFLQSILVEDDVIVNGNLDVNGTLTTIDTTNLKVSDALIELASVGGGGLNNANGGIAIASGSSIDDVSLVFGRGNINNTWRAGRKDTQEGTITDVSDSVLVDIQAAGLRFDNGLYITGSLQGVTNHLTASSVDGGILLDANSVYGVTIDTDLHLASAAAIKAGGRDFIERSPGSSAQVFIPEGRLRLWNLDRGNSTQAPTYNARIELGTDATTIANEALGSDLEDGFRLLMSSSGEIQLYADARGGYENLLGGLRVILSASSAEQEGGPTIILSSSQEYNGGLGNGFEGFIAIGSTQAEVDRDFTMSRHRDVRTLLSGAVGTAGSSTRGVTLVSGDLVISGNTDFKGSVAIGSISTDNLTLSSVGSDEPYLRFRDSSVQINRRTSDDALVFLDGDLGSSRTLRDLASLSVVDNTDVFTISGGEPSYIKTTGSFSFDTDNQYTTDVNGGNSDTYFYVSGSIGSADYSLRPGNGERGTATFGGDMVVSGAVYSGVPLFKTTLQLAYMTPDTMGLKTQSDLSQGAGAVIDTNQSGIPVQIRNPNTADEAVLALTGSLAFEDSGGTGNTRLHMQSNHSFEFHNSSGEIFKMTAGDGSPGGSKNLKLIGNNQIQFEGANQYIYGLTQLPLNHEKLRLHAGLSPNDVDVTISSAGRMEVTGSLYPGADSTYDLGSSAYRWANIYTGDLHLQNERGDWTVIEEEDFLTLRNNKNGKRYKLLMELMDEE